jgi:hypothetical protein
MLKWWVPIGVSNELLKCVAAVQIVRSKQIVTDAQLLCGNLCQLVNAAVNRSLSGKMSIK